MSALKVLEPSELDAAKKELEFLSNRIPDSEFLIDGAEREPEISAALLASADLESILEDIHEFDDSPTWISTLVGITSQAAIVADAEETHRNAERRLERCAQVAAKAAEIVELMGDDPGFSTPVFSDRITDTVIKVIPTLIPTHQTRLRSTLGTKLPNYRDVVEELRQWSSTLAENAKVLSTGGNRSFAKMDWELIFGDQLSRFALAQYSQPLACQTIALIASAVIGKTVSESVYIRWFLKTNKE